MINIILDNSQSRILGLDKPTLYKLRITVCYFNMSLYIRTKNSHASRVFLIDENGFFPTGLMARVRDFLQTKQLMHQVIDNRVVPTSKLLKLENLLVEPPMYDEQKECVKLFLSNPSGTGEMPTGIGKTRVIKEVILRRSRPTLVITPSSNLKHQMNNYLIESFGSKFVSILDPKNPKPISVTNYHSIANIDPRVFDFFEALIFDEYHNFSNNTAREIDTSHFKNIYYKHGLTATNFKNDENSQIMLECILSQNLYSVSTLEAINKGYIVPVITTFFNVTNANLTASGNYGADVKTFIDTNDERNAIAIKTAQQMQKMKVPTLVLVEHVAHGRYLADSLPGFVFLNGQDESAEYNMAMIKKFNAGEIEGIVGTSVIGEGVDTKACGAIINCSGGKARSELMQKVGRAVRKFPNKKVGFYFDFYDNRQKHLLSHSKQRIAIIEEVYGKKVNVLG